MLAPRPSPTKAWISLLEKHAEASQSLQDDKSTLKRNFAWSLDFATAAAVNNIRSSAKEIRAALRLVLDAVVPRPAPQQGIFAAFSELDAKIFGGRFKDAVFLKWSHLDSHTPGRTSTADTVNPRITVELDERLMYGSTAQLVLALLHQMTHTYFLVCCAPRKAAGLPDPRLGHDRHFCAIIYSVLGLFLDRHRPSPRRRWPQHDSIIRRHPHSRRGTPGLSNFRHARRYGNTDGDEPINNCSVCHEMLQCELPSALVMNWYEMECAHIDVSRASTVYNLTDSGPDAQPRIKAGLGSDFVELVWDGKAFKMPVARIEANPSLKLRLARQRNGRELQVPAVSREAFSSLYHFVKTGGYMPELMKVQNNMRTDPAFHSTTGPPEILETRKDWPDYLGTDIRAIKLGAELGFLELESYGLRRLHAQHFTHNDPIGALEAVYESGWIPERLRDWVVSFMAKSLSLRQPGQTERFNLDILQHTLSFTSGMARIMERSGALREDVQRAAMKIASLSQAQNNQMAMVQPPPPPPPPFQLVHQPPYSPHADASLRGNPITLPPLWWDENRATPMGYVDSVGQSTLPPPMNLPRLPPYTYSQPYPPSHGAPNTLNAYNEPWFSENDDRWRWFH